MHLHIWEEKMHNRLDWGAKIIQGQSQEKEHVQRDSREK